MCVSDLNLVRIDANESMSDGARELAEPGDTDPPRFLGFRAVKSYARRATSTSSKYSPARRPVRRLTWR